MNIISLFRKSIGGKSVDSIMVEHKRTIDALTQRSDTTTSEIYHIESEITNMKAKLDAATLERKRADAAAEAMSKVFGIIDAA